MTKPQQPLALVSAGNVTDTPLTRFANLRRLLGPVKAPSRRLASRFVNMLRAGYPADGYADLERTAAVLVAVPDPELRAVLDELARCGIDWTGKAVVACGTEFSSVEMTRLAQCGASTATIMPVPGFGEKLFLAEGDRLALTWARRVVETHTVRVEVIPSAGKRDFLSAQACTGPLLFALLVAAAEHLKAAGISSPMFTSVVHKQAERTLHAYLKSGRNMCPPADVLRGYAPLIDGAYFGAPAAFNNAAD